MDGENDYGQVNDLHVLMLVNVDEEWRDIGGNEYLKEGYIEAKKFTKDIDIRYGLCGIVFAVTGYFPYEDLEGGNWVVVKTEFNDDLTKTEYYYNRYKFKNGIIVHLGDFKSSLKYILHSKNIKDFCFSSMNIIMEEFISFENMVEKYIGEN
jgi:hypothetical protein